MKFKSTFVKSATSFRKPGVVLSSRKNMTPTWANLQTWPFFCSLNFKVFICENWIVGYGSIIFNTKMYQINIIDLKIFRRYLYITILALCVPWPLKYSSVKIEDYGSKIWPYFHTKQNTVQEKLFKNHIFSILIKSKSFVDLYS